MEFLKDLRANGAILVAKVALIVLLVLSWYNVASFTQSTARAVERGLSDDADVDLYSLVDDLAPEAFETARRDEHAVDAVAAFADRLATEREFRFISSYDQPLTVRDPRGDERFDVGYGTEYTFVGPYEDDDGRRVQDVKSIQLNQTAFDFAGLTVRDGDPIVWEDVDWGAGRLPVLLGDTYRGVYEIGQTFTGAVILQEQELEVVGFLEPDSAMYFRGDANHYLDDAVVVPYPPTLGGLDRATLDRLDPDLFGRLAFQVLNADLAVDPSLDIDDVAARLQRIGTETGFGSYALLGVPDYLVQLSLVRQIVRDNLVLVTALLALVTVGVGIVVAFLDRLLRRRRAPIARLHHLLGRSAARTSLLFGPGQLLEYATALGLFLGISAALPNDSGTARCTVGAVLLLWCGMDALAQRRGTRAELGAPRPTGSAR